MKQTIAATFLGVVTVFAFSACATPEPDVPANPLDALCVDLVGYVGEFEDALYSAEDSDPVVVSNQSRFAARNIASRIEIEKRQGLDTTTVEYQWLEQVKTVAESFVVLNESGWEGVSDADAIAALQRVDQWFLYTVEQCTGEDA